jgi:hypothetical protein
MDFVKVVITTHIFAIYMLLIIMIYNYFSISKTTNLRLLIKKIKITTPLYHGLNFAIAYTGATVCAFLHKLNFMIIVMILSTILIMILEIKRYKKTKNILLANTKQQKEIIIYAKKIYTIEIIIVIFTFIMSKII